MIHLATWEKKSKDFNKAYKDSIICDSVLLNINDYIIIPAEFLWLQELPFPTEKLHNELKTDNNLEEYCFELELIIKVAKCHADYT